MDVNLKTITVGIRFTIATFVAVTFLCTSLYFEYKSQYASNDFEEGEQIVTEQAVTSKAGAEVILDVRPDLESGGEPFVRIMEAAITLQPGNTLVIIAPFEPIPLYDVLGARGFSHETTMVAGDEWVVSFFLV